MAKKKDKDHIKLKGTLNKQWNSAREPRKTIDWRWFIYDLFVAGDHYARFDKNTEQILTTPRQKGKPQITINKVYTTLRGVRNFVLRNRPKAEVTPFDLDVEDEESVEEIQKLNLYLSYLHDTLNLRRKLKATVWHALKYSVGFWKVIWDEDAEDEGEIEVSVVDPYDLYWDNTARTPEEARYVILAVKRNVEDLKEDPKYNFEGVLQGDSDIAASALKGRLLMNQKGVATYGKDKDDKSVIVREHWWREKKKGEKDKIMLAAIAGTTVIREPEDTGLSRFPFFRLQSDVEPLSMYGMGWVKNLISPNKQLNRLESQVAEYNDIMNRGKWIADKGAGVRVINNENGQIIEKKRAFEVTQAPIAPLSAAIFQQIENVNRYIEDIGGAHDASFGRIPPGAKSGKALEALQVGDANNMSEVIENVEEFLEDVYEYILEIASDKYQTIKRIIPVTSVGERELVELIGENADNQPDTATVIKKKNIVDVKITSWLAHTAEARRETLKELYDMQAIDKETLLEGYSIGNVSDVIKKTKEEQLEQAATGIEVGAQEAGAAAEATAAAVPQAGAGAQEAIAAIRMLINGGQPNMPQGDVQEFVGYFDKFLQSEEAQSLPEGVLKNLQMFRDTVAQGGQPEVQA